MDINQIAKMIEWLDEERRRDKATIATLEERLSQQQDLIDHLQRRINSIESDQTVMKGEYVTSVEELSIMDNVRREMRQLLEASESRRLNAEREAERRAELARENLSRAIRELSEKIAQFEKHTADWTDMKSERNRLNNVVSNLNQRFEDLIKRLEEPERRLVFLEEQNRQNGRRILETETTLPELRKSIEAIRPKLTLLEDLAIRMERRLSELSDSERERRDQIQQFIDQQALILQQRDQQIKELYDRFNEHDDVMQKNIERFETWSEAYRNMKRIIDDFERIADRLEKRINEVAEMQRLSEDRFRQEWNGWREDDQKRWRQFTLSTDEIWRNHDKEFDSFTRRLIAMEENLNPLRDSLNRLWSLERDRAQMYRERYQALLLEYDTAPSGAKAEPTSSTPNGTTNL